MGKFQRKLELWEKREKEGKDVVEEFKKEDWNSGDILIVEPYEGILSFLNFARKNCPEGKVLDIGCGSGKHAILFAEEGYRSFGIDILTSPAKLSSKHAEKRGQKNETAFGVSDVRKLALKENEFDIVIDHNLLIHIPKREWGQYIDNVKRVIKSGGYFYLAGLSTETEECAGFRPDEKNNEFIDEEGGCFHFLREEEVKNSFSDEFKIIKSYQERDRVETNAHLICFMEKK